MYIYIFVYLYIKRKTEKKDNRKNITEASRVFIVYISTAFEQINRSIKKT